MLRMIPTTIFLGMMLIAAVLSADIGPRFVQSPQATVWYEPGITAEQAESFLQQVTADLEAEGRTADAKPLNFRLMRGEAAIRVCFDDMNLAGLTTETSQYLADYGLRVGAAIWPGEPLVVEASDGAGRSQVLSSQAPTPPSSTSQAVQPETAPVAG